MNRPGRNTLIGLGVGATASIGVVALLVMYRRMKRRICQSLTLPSNSDTLLSKKDGSSTAVSRAFEVKGASLEDLSPRLRQGSVLEQQVELRNTLYELLQAVACLRSEVCALRGDLQDVAAHIVQDVKKDLEEGQRLARRRRLPPRERTDSRSSSSVYFSANSRYEGESEGGYTTANGESDCCADPDKEKKRGGEEDEEDEEDRSHVTESTLRWDSSDAEMKEDEAFSDAESQGDPEAPPPPGAGAFRRADPRRPTRPRPGCRKHQLGNTQGTEECHRSCCFQWESIQPRTGSGALALVAWQQQSPPPCMACSAAL
ncbi:hypothetical protein GJAV_G00108420 [Gymnothorax javanicus]|nr:hypothetical protein GJAV_G00108420 [Gymnothorax javanicus]